MYRLLDVEPPAQTTSIACQRPQLLDPVSRVHFESNYKHHRHARDHPADPTSNAFNISHADRSQSSELGRMRKRSTVPHARRYEGTHTAIDHAASVGTAGTVAVTRHARHDGVGEPAIARPLALGYSQTALETALEIVTRMNPCLTGSSAGAPYFAWPGPGARLVCLPSGPVGHVFRTSHRALASVGQSPCFSLEPS